MAGFKRYKWQDTTERNLLSKYEKKYYAEFLDTNRFSIPYLRMVHSTIASLPEKECMKMLGILNTMYWRRLRLLSISAENGLAKPIIEE